MCVYFSLGNVVGISFKFRKAVNDRDGEKHGMKTTSCDRQFHRQSERQQ